MSLCACPIIWCCHLSWSFVSSLGSKTSNGYITAGNEACLELVLITIGPEAPRVYKILPGKSPLFRRFQHQTPFSEGGRGSPVWVKLNS